MASGRSSLIVSYPAEHVFFPGLSDIELLVTEGAPMTVECSLSLLPHLIEKRKYMIKESGVVVRKKLNFRKPGIYSVLCNFVGETSKSSASTLILVNKRGNPVTVTSNSPVQSGDTVRHRVDFGRWKNAVEVTGRGYFEPTFTDGMFDAGHSTQLNTFLDVLNGVTYEHKLKEDQKGTLYVRFILDIDITEGAKEQVDVVSPVAVQTAIDQISVNVISSAPQHELRKKVALTNGQSVSDILYIPAGITISFNGESEAFVSSWGWSLDGEEISNTRNYNFSFTFAVEQKIEVEARNDLFEFTASFNVRPYTSVENVFVLKKNAVKPGVFEKIALVTTSTMEVAGFREESELSISSTVVVKDTGQSVGQTHLSLAYRNLKICFDAKSNPMGEKLSAHDLGDKIAKSYCVLEYQLIPLPQPDLYKITVSASNEDRDVLGSVDVCVSKMTECSLPVVSIKKDETPADEVRVFEIGENIHLWSELVFDKCEGYSHQRTDFDYSWTVHRIQDQYADLSAGNPSRYFDTTWKPLTVNKSELVLSGRTLTKGTYHVSCAVQVRSYCGAKPYVAYDFLRIRVTPGNVTAVIAGGGSSLQYVSKYSVVTLRGLAYSLAEVEIEQTDIVFSWFCRKKEEENTFVDFYEKHNEEPEGGGGCFDHGFVVTLDDTVQSDTQSRKLAKDWPADKQMLHLNVSKFHKIPGVYTFRLVMYNGAGEKSYADRQVDLREASEDVMRLMEVLTKDKESGQPRVEIDCINNCGKILNPSDPLHLKAKCVNCIENRDGVELLYKWVVDQPKERDDTSMGRNSYSPGSREPQLRLRPSALSRTGEYNVTVDMIARSEEMGTSVTISTARRRLYIAEPPPVRTCTVVPSSGIALLTKFKIGCYSREENGGIFYEMSYFDPSRGGRRKSRGKNEVLFYRGFKNVAQNTLLPVGDKSFGHKLIIKVKLTQQDTKRSSDAFLFAVVTPVLAEKQESLLKELLLGEESKMSDLSKKKRLDDFLMLINSAVSTIDKEGMQDIDVVAKVTESVLDEMLSFTPTSLKTVGALSTMLKVTMNFAYGLISQQHLAKLLNSVEKADQLIYNLLEFMVHQTDEEPSKNIDEITDIGRTIVGVIVQCVHSLTSIREDEAGNNTSNSDSNTTLKSQHLRRNLLRNFNRLMFLSSSIKNFGETPTDLSTDDVSVKVRNEIVRGDSLASLPPFSNTRGIKLDQATTKGNSNDKWTVRSAVSVFSKSPVPLPTNRTTDNLPVVGISVEIERDNDTMTSTDVLHNRQVHVLIPFEGSPRKSKSVNLLRPCKPQEQRNGLSSVIMSIPTITRANEVCGSTVLTMKLGGRGGRRRRGLAAKSEFAGSALVIRPSRPCRLPDRPCVKISLVATSAAEANQDENLRNVICKDAESREQNCHDFYTVIHSATLPREMVGKPTEFDADPWSIPIPDSLLNEIQALDEDEVTIVVEHLQTDPIYSEDELDWYQNVTLDVIQPSCMVWDDYKNEWDDLACGKAEIARHDMIHCICGSATSLPFEVASSESEGSQPFLVTAKLVIVPNSIDFTDVASLLLRLRSHYHALMVILLAWFLFIVPLPWAIREDKKSSRGYIVVPADNDPRHDYLYEVVVFTAMLRGSGTSAKVTIVLEGSNGLSSEPRVISTPDKSTLQRGGKDSFLIATDKCLGDVVRVRLWHDNSGEHPSWHVNRISIFDLHDGRRSPSYFLVNAWLSLDIYPFHCDIAVDLQPKERFLTFKNLWRIRVAYCCSEEDVWLAPFFRTKCSPFTRVQRLACTAFSLFFGMLTSIMFCEAANTTYQFKLGFVDLDLSPVVMSLQTACAMAPFEIVVTFIFSHIDRVKGAKEELMATLYKEARRRKHRRSVLENCEERGDPEMKLRNREEKMQSIPTTAEKRNFQDSKYNEEQSHDIRCRIVQSDISDSGWISLDNYTRSIVDLTLEDGLDECREMRKIAEKIEEECMYYRSISSDPRSEKRRIHVKIHTNPPTQESNIVVEQVGEQHAMPHYHSPRAWYKNFRAKRLLRRRRMSQPPDAEVGDDGMVVAPSFTSLADFVDELSESGSIGVDNIENIDLDDIVFLPKLTFTLPSWLAKIMLFIILVAVLSCSFFTLLYGLTYSKGKFRRWLTTFFLSLIQNILVTTPIRIAVTAAVLAFLSRNKVDLQDWTAFTGSIARVDAVVKWRQTQMRFRKAKENSEIRSRTIGMNMPVDKGDRKSETTVRQHAPLLHLIKSGKRSLAVKQLKRFWLESTLWIFLAILVSTLIYLQRDPRLVRINRQVSDYFESAIEEVSLKEDVYSFLDESIAPTLYRDSDTDSSDQFQLLGPIRVRQLRFSVHDRCYCFSMNLSRVPCACKYRDDEVGSDYYYDATSYDPFWRTAENTSSGEDYMEFISPWRYRPIEHSVGTHLLIGSILQRPYYPIGGYIVDLGYSLTQVRSTIAGLKNSGWIDIGTAAVIVEFSGLNPATGHVSAATFIFEFLASGGMNRFTQTHSYRPIYIYSVLDIAIIGMQLMHVGCTGIIMWSLLRQCARAKWQISAVLYLLADVWNALSVVIIFVTVASYSVYFKHITSGILTTRAMNEDPSEFVAFSVPAYYSAAYSNLMGFVAFFTNIHLLMVMRGSRIVSVMNDTLLAAYDGIGSVTVFVCTMIFGFCMTGLVSFSPYRWDFHSLVTVFSTLTSLAAGMEAPHPESRVTAEVWWSLYHLFYTMFTLVFVVNLYAAVLGDALYYIRNRNNETDSHRVETLALDWLYEKVAGYLGIRSKKFSRKKIKLREPPGPISRQISEAMRRSLMVDPAFVPLEVPEKNVATQRGSAVQKERYNRRRSLEHKTSLSK